MKVYLFHWIEKYETWIILSKKKSSCLKQRPYSWTSVLQTRFYATFSSWVLVSTIGIRPQLLLTLWENANHNSMQLSVFWNILLRILEKIRVEKKW